MTRLLFIGSLNELMIFILRTSPPVLIFWRIHEDIRKASVRTP